MAFRFTTVVIAILLIAGGIAVAVAMGDDPAAPISRGDDQEPDQNQIEEDLDAALRQDDDPEQDDAVEAADDDTTGDTDTKNDTNDESGGGTGGSGGSGGSG